MDFVLFFVVDCVRWLGDFVMSKVSLLLLHVAYSMQTILNFTLVIRCSTFSLVKTQLYAGNRVVWMAMEAMHSHLLSIAIHLHRFYIASNSKNVRFGSFASLWTHDADSWHWAIKSENYFYGILIRPIQHIYELFHCRIWNVHRRYGRRLFRVTVAFWFVSVTMELYGAGIYRTNDFFFSFSFHAYHQIRAYLIFVLSL